MTFNGDSGQLSEYLVSWVYFSYCFKVIVIFYFSKPLNAVSLRHYLNKKLENSLNIRCFDVCCITCALRKIETTDFIIQWNLHKWLCRRTSSKKCISNWTHLFKIKMGKSLISRQSNIWLKYALVRESQQKKMLMSKLVTKGTLLHLLLHFYIFVDLDNADKLC